MLLMAVVILAGAQFIKALGDTFHVRHTYANTLTLVIYGLSPVFMFRLLDVFPAVSLWMPWALGIMLTIKVLYHGVPRMMLPNPPDAFGLYLMSALLLLMVTALERFVTAGCLGGSFKQVENMIIRPCRPAAVLKMKAPVGKKLPCGAENQVGNCHHV